MLFIVNIFKFNRFNRVFYFCKYVYRGIIENKIHMLVTDNYQHQILKIIKLWKTINYCVFIDVIFVVNMWKTQFY